MQEKFTTPDPPPPTSAPLELQPLSLTYQNLRSPRPPEVTAAVAVLLVAVAIALGLAYFAALPLALMLVAASLVIGLLATALLRRSERARAHLIMLTVSTGFILPVILAYYLVLDLSVENIVRHMTGRFAIGAAAWGLAATVYVLLTRDAARDWFVDEEYRLKDNEPSA